MTAAGPSPFDTVSVERLRRRRTVKWTLYGPDVLAAWVAEMDFDVAPAVRAALLYAVDREDFGYVEADLSELTTACADFWADAYGWSVSPRRVFPVADVLSGIVGALAAVVEAHGARVVADEVHGPLTYSGHPFVPYASVGEAASHALTVTSASKAWNLAGLKCAQAVATNHDDADRWRRIPLFAVPGPTPLGIAASTAAHRDARDWRADLVAYLDGNRRRLVELVEAELPGVRLHPPEGTFLAWLDCAALGFDDPARFFLDAARVAVSDGPAYGGPAGGYDQHVRLNVATSAALLEQIVGAMGDALRRR